MRARLTKLQVQMLLEGKGVRSPRHNFVLPDGSSEIREMLQQFMDFPEAFQRFDIILDTDKQTVIVKEKNWGERL